MPVVSLTIEDADRTILTTTYYKIIRDIVDSIKIPYGTLVVLHKDTEVSLTDNRSNATLNTKENLPSTIANRRIQASITEDYDEDSLTTTAVHQPSAYPIFQDHDIDVYIYPVYIKSDINIQFTYISPSKTEAIRIRDDIRLRLSQTRNIDIHEIEYVILIPEIVEEFIADVHDLKKRLVPQSLEDYFREHSTKRIFPITDMSNKENTKLAVQEKQVRIVGTFDFNSMPEKIDIDNENNNYKISFNYKLSMDIPRAIVMRYPVMICNRPLPSKYISFIAEHRRNSKEEHKKQLGYTSGGIAALSHFEAHRQLENRLDIKLPLNIPDFDEFNLRQAHKGYAILASFLVQVDETDKKSLFNLRDIDPYYIPENLLEFIKTTERHYITKPYMSFLYMGLHQDDIHYDNSILEIDENLNVKSKVELSLFKPVRVTISIIIDFSILNRNATKRLTENPEIFYIFLNEHINAYNNFKTELPNMAITDNTFYRHLIISINHFLGLEQTNVVSEIFEIIKEDRYVYSNLTNFLRTGYFDLYNKLTQKKILSDDSVSSDKHHTNNQNSISSSSLTSVNQHHTRSETEELAMKTVMTNYVVVGRRN